MATYAAYFHFPPLSTPDTISTTGSPAASSPRTLVQHQTPLPISYNATHPRLLLHTPEPSLLSPAAQDSKSTHTSSATTSTYKPAEGLGSMRFSEQTNSLFFQLPAELRNKIYSLLLSPNAVPVSKLAASTVDLAVRGFNQMSTSVSLFPEILSTCKKIHNEAVGLLYGTHIFHAHPSLLTSLPHLTSSAKPVLHNSVISRISRWQICLRLDTDPRFTFQQAKDAFSGAEYLEIRVWQAQFEACDFSILKLFTGVRGVGVARVGGSVDEGLARWLEGVMQQPQDRLAEEGCECGVDCPGFEGRGEVLCGRCYRKLGCLSSDADSTLPFWEIH